MGRPARRQRRPIGGCAKAPSAPASSYPGRVVGERTRAKWQGFWALIGVLVAACLLAASALAFVTVYKNNFNSKAGYKEVVRVGGGQKACSRDWNQKREIMAVELGKAPAVCTFKPPVQGDNSQPDHRFDAEGRILKKTAENIRDEAYLSIAIRVGGGNRYELRVFPKGKDYQLRRQPTGAGFPMNGSNPAIGGIGQRNLLRLLAEGNQISAFVNGTPVATTVDPNANEIAGAKVEFGVGNNADGKKNTAATFDKLKLAVPDP